MYLNIAQTYLTGFMQNKYCPYVDAVVDYMVTHSMKTMPGKQAIDNISVSRHEIDFISGEDVIATTWISNYPYAYGTTCVSRKGLLFFVNNCAQDNPLTKLPHSITSMRTSAPGLSVYVKPSGRPSVRTIAKLRMFERTIHNTIKANDECKQAEVDYYKINDKLVDYIRADSIITQ
jgi:hypothetical protein